MGQGWNYLGQDQCCCSTSSRVEERTTLPPNHNAQDSDSASSIIERATVLAGDGKHSEAEPLFRMALAATEEQFGEDHDITLDCLCNLAGCLCNQGKYELAEPLLRKAVRLADSKDSSGADPSTVRMLRNLRICLDKVGKETESEEIEARLARAQFRSRALGSFRGCLSMADEPITDRPNIVLITDPGQDNDDEMALLLASQLMRDGEMGLLAVIANLTPAGRRAALARGTLDMLGLIAVPVGIGTDGGSNKHSDTFSEFISVGKTGVDYLKQPLEDVTKVEKALGTHLEEEVCQKCCIFDGQKLLRKTLTEADNKSVTLVLVSSLKDVALFLRQNEKLFVDKVVGVTTMGGTKIDDATGKLRPSDAHNNVFDMPSAEFFYLRCQVLGVPITVLSRFAAYGCPLQKKVYDLMVRCPVPNPVVCRLQRAQRMSIENLWCNVCEGGILPARCDKQWFCDTFCGGEGTDRRKNDSMWELVKTFNMYDPLALLAAIPARQKQFFEPTQHSLQDGIMNSIIGTSAENSGISHEHKEDLHDFLMTTWIRVAGHTHDRGKHSGHDERPVELDAEQLTAALTPMTTHSPEELQELNRNVLWLVDNEWPKLKNSSFLSTWKERDRLMRKIGPPMMLLDPQTLARLGRIPHSAEDRAIKMEVAAELAEKEGKRFFIEMFSHRWHSQYAPDDRHNNKARVLVEWARYRNLSMGFRTFFWIDYCCINQSDIAPGVAMLPLYVSCCNNIVCYDTPPYEPRAWCRVERLMFVSFVAPNTEYVRPAFAYDENAAKNARGELTPSEERKELVADPSGDDSLLSYKADSELIKQLKALCTEHWAKCWKEGLLESVEKGGLKEIRKLRYGGTEVRVRRF